MKGMASVSIDTPNGAAATHVRGTLNLVQTGPTKIQNNVRIVFDDDPISAEQFKTKSLPQILLDYNDRAQRTVYEYTPLVQSLGDTHTTKIEMDIDIPKTQIEYVPGVLETFKHAWNQYIYLSIPIFWLASVISGFIFRN